MLSSGFLNDLCSHPLPTASLGRRRRSLLLRTAITTSLPTVAIGGELAAQRRGLVVSGVRCGGSGRRACLCVGRWCRYEQAGFHFAMGIIYRADVMVTYERPWRSLST